MLAVWLFPWGLVSGAGLAESMDILLLEQSLLSLVLQLLSWWRRGLVRPMSRIEWVATESSEGTNSGQSGHMIWISCTVEIENTHGILRGCFCSPRERRSQWESPRRKLQLRGVKEGDDVDHDWEVGRLSRCHAVTTVVDPIDHVVGDQSPGNSGMKPCVHLRENGSVDAELHPGQRGLLCHLCQFHVLDGNARKQCHPRWYWGRRPRKSYRENYIYFTRTFFLRKINEGTMEKEEGLFQVHELVSSMLLCHSSWLSYCEVFWISIR